MAAKTKSALENPRLCAPKPDEAEVVRRILCAMTGLEFGAVEISVQKSKAVQIDRTQRSRFAQPLEIPHA